MDLPVTIGFVVAGAVLAALASGSGSSARSRSPRSSPGGGGSSSSPDGGGGSSSSPSASDVRELQRALNAVRRLALEGIYAELTSSERAAYDNDPDELGSSFELFTRCGGYLDVDGLIGPCTQNAVQRADELVARAGIASPDDAASLGVLILAGRWSSVRFEDGITANSRPLVAGRLAGALVGMSGGSA